jgi:hypothetical protein
LTDGFGAFLVAAVNGLNEAVVFVLLTPYVKVGDLNKVLVATGLDEAPGVET